jgi:tetraacyldisaccharide 4'-kinase
MGPEAIALSPLGVLYGLGWLSYKLVYDLGIKKAKEPHCPVVCVGSMIAGGAGKTPITRFVAQTLLELDRRVVIGMSGYRAANRQGATLAPPGPLDPAEWGDESAAMRDLLPDVPLVVGRDRVMAAQIVHDSLPDHVLLMDDGFQHLPLKKHVQIVLDPPNLSNRLPLPAGAYREVWHLGKKRADLLLPSESFSLQQGPSAYLLNGEEETWPPSKVQLLCGIARPYRITWQLEMEGVRVVKGSNLDDHAKMDQEGLLQGFDPQIPIVTTLKDWVKLRERPDHKGWTFLVLRHTATIEPADDFRRWLAARLSELK